MCRTYFDCLLGSPSVPGMTSTKAKGFWPTWKTQPFYLTPVTQEKGHLRLLGPCNWKLHWKSSIFPLMIKSWKKLKTHKKILNIFENPQKTWPSKYFEDPQKILRSLTLKKVWRKNLQTWNIEVWVFRGVLLSPCFGTLYLSQIELWGWRN